MRKLWIVAVSVVLASCGGDENNVKKGGDTGVSDAGNNGVSDAGNNGVSDLGTDTGDTPDMGPGEDMATSEDMGVADTGMEDMGTDMSEGPCDRNGMMFVSEAALWDGFQFLYSGFTAEPMAAPDDMGAAPMYDFLSFEVYPDFGGVVGAQNYTFTGLNYSECGTCLLVFADCTLGESCGKTFLVDSGSVEVSEMGSAQDAPFKATFNQLMFSEVTIDTATYESTKVVGGETYCVDMVSADTATTDTSM